MFGAIRMQTQPPPRANSRQRLVWIASNTRVFPAFLFETRESPYREFTNALFAKNQIDKRRNIQRVDGAVLIDVGLGLKLACDQHSDERVYVE